MKLLLILLLAFPVMAHATHLERGCKEAPAHMEVPHWVQSHICTGSSGVWATKVDVGSSVSDWGHRFVSFFATREARDTQDMNQWTASSVWEILPNGKTGRLLVYGTSEGRQYVAGGVVEGLDL